MKNLSREQRYIEFIKELVLLSNKYGVSIDSTEGVFIPNDLEKIDSISYDCDYTSGDLRSEITFKTNN